jgi:hypothetical protein
MVGEANHGATQMCLLVYYARQYLLKRWKLWRDAQGIAEYRIYIALKVYNQRI